MRVFTSLGCPLCGKYWRFLPFIRRVKMQQICKLMYKYLIMNILCVYNNFIFMEF